MSVSRREPISSEPAGHGTGVSKRTSMNWLPRSRSFDTASSSSWKTYSFSMSKDSHSIWRMSAPPARAAMSAASRPKNSATPMTVACPTVTWNLDLVAQGNLKNLIFSTATIAALTTRTVLGAATRPRSMEEAWNCLTRMPMRSPFEADCTGSRNIWMDLTCFVTPVPGISTMSLGFTLPFRTVPVSTVPLPGSAKQWSTAKRKPSLASRAPFTSCCTLARCGSFPMRASMRASMPWGSFSGPGFADTSSISVSPK
mmetsp:Transcript_2892/g.10145  ORF Transcript_2892/g.10145 Transcript_2892/m.10145 type:complete len:256 (-) Transcript_2892:519-1286(-)